MEECKSPEAEDLMAAAVRDPNQAASAAARVEAQAHAAVAGVQDEVDARRAEALAAVRAESQGRRAAAASAAATAAFATAAPSLLSPSPAVSEAAGVTSAEVLHWQGRAGVWRVCSDRRRRVPPRVDDGSTAYLFWNPAECGSWWRV